VLASFGFDPSSEVQFEWTRTIVAADAEPLDLVFGGAETNWARARNVHDAVLRPLQHRARAEGLWPAGLAQKLSGKKHDQGRPASTDEGRSSDGPTDVHTDTIPGEFFREHGAAPGLRPRKEQPGLAIEAVARHTPEPTNWAGRSW
jgi:hypothetical protein